MVWSRFVYKKGGMRHAVPDLVGQANMFKVRMDRPFWHVSAPTLQGYLAHKKRPPLLGPP